MKSEKSQKGKGGKIAVSIICILMSLVIVFLCLQVFGKGKVKPSEWFKGEMPGASDPIGGGMIIPDHNEPNGEQGVSGIALKSLAIPAVSFAEYGVSEQAESAYTVTATVEPDNEATNTAIIWDIAWNDPSSAWASGKTVTDYVTATPAGESLTESKTVTVACLQSFGEPIILTAKCRYDETITATVQIDYAPRLTMTEYVATNLTDAMNNHYSITWGGETAIPFELGEPANRVNFYPTRIAFKSSGDFTLNDTYTAKLKCVPVEKVNASAGLSFGISGGVQEVELGEYTTANLIISTMPSISPNSNPFDISIGGVGRYMSGSFMNTGTKIFYDYINQDSSKIEEAELNINQQIKDFGSINLCNIDLIISGEHISYEFQTKIMITKTMYNIVLSGITLDKTTIVM